MLRKDHSPDESMNIDAPGGSQNRIHIDLGGPTLLLLLAATIVIGAAGVVIGLDIAERSLQQRQTATESAAVQRAIAKQTADLERAWELNTQHLQRDWFLNTSQLQRSWESETAIQTKKMEDLQRQWRMAELKLDDTTVVLHRAGLQLPGDYTRGPQGNLDSESFHIQTLPVWSCSNDNALLCTTDGGNVWEPGASFNSEPK